MYRGLSAFALLHPTFPVNRYLTAMELEPTPGVPILWSTFGKRYSHLNTVLEFFKGKNHLLEIHLSNEAGRRNRRLSGHEFLPNLSVDEYNQALKNGNTTVKAAIIKKINKIATTIKPMVNKRTEVVLSTGLEDNFTLDAYKGIYNLCEKFWPYQITRSPVGSTPAPILDADYLELHGNHPKFGGNPAIYNNDGTEISHFEFQDITREIPNLYAGFWWLAPLQGIVDNTFIPPLKRRFVLSDKNIEFSRKLFR